MMTPERMIELALVMAAGGAYVLVVRRSPKFGVLATLLVIAFVPIWVGLTIYVSAASTAAGLTAIALATRRLPVWTLGDLLFAILLMCALLPYTIGVTTFDAAFGAVMVWAVGYAFGRLAVDQLGATWMYSCVAIVFAVVGVLAVIELVFSWHGLASWGPNTALRQFWGEIITRGALDRSEGAFGHSIALGAALAIAVTMAVESRWVPWLRILLIAAMVAGAAASLSRTGVISTLFGLALAIVFLRSPAARQVRGRLIVLAVIATAIIVPFQMSALAEDQGAVGSAAYRSDLADLIGYIDAIGTSGAIQISPSGTPYFGNFQSIDNQLLIFGLNYGWFTVVAFLAIVAYFGVSVLAGRVSSAELAVFSQLPALITVALITQYAIFFWIAVGLAVGARAENWGTTMARNHRAGPRPVARESTVR